MSKKSKILAVILGLLSSILLILCIYGLGVLIGSNLIINKYVCITIMVLDGLLLLLSIINLFRSRRFNNKLKKQEKKRLFKILIKAINQF